jgi:uncharacterized protein
VAPAQDEAAALVISIAQILGEGLALEVPVAPEALDVPLGGDAAVEGKVQVQGRLDKIAEQIYFQGRIRGVVAAPCSRCLETVHTDFVADTRVVFLPSTSHAIPGEESRLSSADELDVYMHDGVVLDLRPLVREQVVLAFPVQPLCREDCAGLCQICGGNRNVELCTCQAQSEDPRFAILKQLRLPKTS